MSIKLPKRYSYTGDKLSGGFGEVRIYDDTNLDRKVAIKVVPDVSDMQRVLDEISALQKIRSKHIVQIYDIVVGAVKGEIAIVEEYIPGSDLTKFSGQTSAGRKYLKVLYQIASGIADVHNVGVIHRDIKPNNMKFDYEGLIKIFDFGLARDDAKALTVGFKGTRGFAAPELFKPGKVFFTKAVDVYAFGATAWYLAQGSLPDNLLKLPPDLKTMPSFSSLPIDVPTNITDLLDSTLLADPNDRPQMATIRNTLAKRLVFGRHQAIIVFGSKVYNFNKVGQVIQIGAEKMGKLEIKYTGESFDVITVEGKVYMNNLIVKPGDSLPGSCVITIGSPERGLRRKFLPFDISYPEVVL
jgi:serine/threonine-protein kinase